jgi:hypothetical protein
VPGAQGGGMSVRGGVIFFDCLVCARPVSTSEAKRDHPGPTPRDHDNVSPSVRLTFPYPQIASNRYAPHLASCLGLTGASRRGTSRAAAVNGIQKSRYVPPRLPREWSRADMCKGSIRIGRRPRRMWTLIPRGATSVVPARAAADGKVGRFFSLAAGSKHV